MVTKVSTRAGRSFAAIVVAGLAAFGAAGAQDLSVIDARKAQLKSASAAMKTIQGFVKDDAGTAADVQKAAATLVEVSSGMPKWFPEGTAVGVGKSDALPDIWKNKDDFAKKIAAFQAESKTMQTVAASGDKAAIGKQLAAVGGTCKACHDSYKQKS